MAVVEKTTTTAKKVKTLLESFIVERLGLGSFAFSSIVFVCFLFDRVCFFFVSFDVAFLFYMRTRF